MREKAKLGDIITLQRQDVKVEKCEKCGSLMVNVDAKDLRPGDLITLKLKGVKISNPDTKDLICVSCEYPVKEKETFGDKVSRWFNDSDGDDDDDSHFFGSSGMFGGGGGFGGFGGGSFGGGGASRGF